MHATALDTWAESFTAFHARFADLFARSESRQQAVQYVRGLLAPVERKNGWQVAEAVGDAVPDRMQRLLYRVAWDADAAQDRLQRYVVEHFGDPDAIGVVDETSVPKKGSASVGVQRQYCGALGKIENCQVATLLTYASGRGHAFLDRRLFLPEAWATDAQRRARAKVPPAVVFQTKAQQARAMLEHAWQQGVPMRWVAGDEVYGADPDLRDAIAATGRWYVLAVTSATTVWTGWPQRRVPPGRGMGRPPTRAQWHPAGQPVAAVAQGWPAAQWQRFAVAEGEKGPRVYDWAAVRIVESRAGRPHRDAWLLVRRSVSEPTELAYYLSNAPADTALRALARIVATRYTVEQCIEEAKGEVGLDHYEVRHYHSWYRHVTLALMAHTWLAVVRSQVAEKGGPLALRP